MCSANDGVHGGLELAKMFVQILKKIKYAVGCG
jgi:hypothetical protein